MALSSLTYVSRGRGPYPLAGLDYLDTAHLAATVNGVPATAAFDAVARTMLLDTAAAAGTSVVIQRTTPRLREERLTQYLSLPSGQGGLTAALLDQDYRQEMLLAGEARDIADSLDPPDNAMVPNAGGQWDGESMKLTNLLAGTDANNAITKAQLDAAIAATPINLPVAVLDVDDGLMVVGGAWDDLAPAGFRTALGLGTAALVNQGTGANQTPALDGITDPASYAAADGRNIDLANHPIQADIAKRALATVVYLTHPIAGISNNNIDPAASPTWSAAAGTRVGSLATPFTNRVELNNSSDVAFNTTPQYFTLSAGTWRVRWVANVRGPSGVFDPWAFRITNDDDTTGQTIYYDSGVQYVLKQPGGSNIRAVYSDEVVLTPASSSRFTFRFATPNVLGAGLILRLFFHKVSTSLAS